MAEQRRFAELSGDRNPLHLDAIAARRTTAGGPVVHGVHLVLWALESLARAGVDLARFGGVDVQFEHFVPVDRVASLHVGNCDESRIKVTIRVDSIVCVTMKLRFGDRSETPGTSLDGGDLPDLSVPEVPVEVPVSQLAARCGWITPADVAGRLIGEEFPSAVHAVGVYRLVAWAALSAIVGMLSPGLRSVFSTVSLTMTNAADGGRPGVGFAVRSVDPRFNLVTMGVIGSGLEGEIAAFIRPELAAPPPMASLTALVNPSEFAGSRSLVIGGSRGLGAVTAKLLASGGGTVIITYVRGATDALAVEQDIHAARGSQACSCVELDVTTNRGTNLQALLETSGPISHLYYFATPQIFRQRGELFSAATFLEFTQVYVDAFYDIVEVLRRQASRIPLRVFAPSSIAVTSRPRGLTEYAMAKAAAELLSVDLCQQYPTLRIDTPRLPRLPTDQTATMYPVESADPVETLLPLLRSLHALA